MKKNSGFMFKTSLAFFGIAGVVLGLFVGVEANFSKLFRASGATYTLTLDTQKISTETSSYSGERDSTIRTGLNNSISIKASNVIKYNSGWQTILPNGYFYNPITSSTNHNKINGIKSISFTSPASSSLSLYYGSTADNTQIIYSHEVTLNSGTAYTFTNDYPSYFYIKNKGNSNVNINSFTITYSCSDSGYAKQNYKVLMIGNSYSDDTIFYASRVANAYGVNFEVYDAYIAGCDIATHYSNYTSDNESYSMRSINNGSWVYQDEMTLRNIVASKTWDIITFQQSSASSGNALAHFNLSNLVSGIRSQVGSGPKFYWYQTWAYDSGFAGSSNEFTYYNNDQTTMFNSICNVCTTQIAAVTDIVKIIPAGTAVQNMRTTYMGDTLSRDGKHMSSVHGRYLLALNFFSNIFDVDLDLSPCAYLPEGANEAYKDLCYESVKNAYNNKFVCTTSGHSLAPYNFDLSNYTEIDAGLVGCSYWDSTDATNYNKRICNVQNESNKYVSTKQFTSSTLPVGSKIVIGEQYGVLPEAWTSDSVQSTRPAEIYNNIITIDSSFFSGYQYRAFNIFKAGKSALNEPSNQCAEILDNFHIYVPNSQMGSLTPKGYNSNASADSALFNNKGYYFTSYERLFYDPIAGFQNCTSGAQSNVTYNGDTAKKFVCSKPFYASCGDLPENTIIIADSGYQWRSDCWGDSGTYSPRPNNVTDQFSVLGSSFWNGLRRRTFNISTTSSSYVNQNHLDFANHVRIYVPISGQPVKVPTPEGTFKTTTTVRGGTYQIIISIGKRNSNLVAVRLSNLDAVATGYTYNEATGAISISTTGSFEYDTQSIMGVLRFDYGTITCTYDSTNDRLINVGCGGSIKNYVDNNGSLIATRPLTSSETYFNDCDGSTSELQSEFKRRYMSGSWQVDSGNADRITSNTTEFVSGSGALKRRGYSGGAVALNLNSDWSTAKTLTNIQYWVYNPSSSDIVLQMWIYKKKNFDSNAEIGSVTAKANGWTYVAMGFGTNNIYNFQIADFNNTGVYLTFDNIYLFK